MFRNSKQFIKIAFTRSNHTAIIYTNGSLYNKYKKTAGIGIYFPDGEHYDVCKKIPAVSKNFSEMVAVDQAIDICKLLDIGGIIYTDSEYVIRKIYAPNYLTNLKGLTIKDFEYIDYPGIVVRHVKSSQYLDLLMPGHKHSVGNAVATTLAKYGAKM